MGDISKLEQCVLDLHEIGVLKFGNFTLKSGMQSPFYFDLRIIVSHPKLLETVSELVWEARPNNEYNHICGVPYTALPIATVISTKQNLPMLIRRKESKGYGTKKMVEGIFEEGQTCLMIEDVIVSGTSVYETVQTLRELELNVKDAVVFLDREHGGTSNLKNMDVNAVSVITISKMLDILLKYEKISTDTSESVKTFVDSHKSTSIIADGKASLKQGETLDRERSTLSERASSTNQPLARKLFELMMSKSSNLCVAADVHTTQELCDLAEKVGPYICILKTHIDIISDFTPDTTRKLLELKDKHNFLIMEDRKFGDIGNTVVQQYGGGIYNIVDWADLVTVHPLPGDGIIKGLVSSVNGRPRGCVLISEMSCQGSYSSQNYVNDSLKMAEENTYFVIGFVAQNGISKDPRFIQMTPGVKIDRTADGLGQQYVTPQAAVLQKGADVIIVGRGITQSDDPATTAKEYREKGFSAYLERVSR